MTSTLTKLSLAAAAFAICAPAQTTVTISTDKDTSLYEDAAGALANGAGDSIFCGVVGFNGNFGKRRALMHFDIAGQIPAGSRILSVQFDAFVAQSTAFLSIPTMMHRVTQDWNEGSVVAPGAGGMGGTSTAGETTWLHTNYPNATWTNPGGDFDPTPSFTYDMAAIGPTSAEVNAGMVADVQDWLDNPAGNFGWLMKTDENVPTTARRLYSREFGANPPRLTISYLAPGDVGTYGTGTTVGGAPFMLDLVGTGAGGSSVTINYSNAPTPSIGANFFSLDLDPVGTPLGPTTTVYLPVAGQLLPGDAFLTVGGTGTTQFTVPAGFPGYLITVQAAVINVGGPGFSLSNAGVIWTN